MLNQLETASTPGILASPASRRRFLKGAALSAGVAATTLSAAAQGIGGVIGVDPSSGPAPAPADIFQFALNLEYFEATFYSYVVNGTGIPAALLGPNPGAVTGFPAVKFSDPLVQAVAQQLAADELTHVMFIRDGLEALGVTPVSLPALNLTALGAPVDDNSFLALARGFETVGTSAYEGGVQYLAISGQAVTYAALIHDAEGQHEASLRQFCIQRGVTSPAVDHLDRPPVLSNQGIFNTSPVTGLNTARNASEVLQILYAAAGKTGVSSGGFFPNGLNGNVKTT